MAERGGPIRSLAEMDENAATEAYHARQQLTRTVAHAVRRDGGMPQESSLIFAPRNNSTRDMSKASCPEV